MDKIAVTEQMAEALTEIVNVFDNNIEGLIREAGKSRLSSALYLAQTALDTYRADQKAAERLARRSAAIQTWASTLSVDQRNQLSLQLDEEVHEIASRSGSDINNGGVCPSLNTSQNPTAATSNSSSSRSDCLMESCRRRRQTSQLRKSRRRTDGRQ